MAVDSERKIKFRLSAPVIYSAVSKPRDPLVSVIMPMFNSAKFIPQTLESLLYQTMTDFEVVVIDDGSTDNSVEVVESFSARFDGRLHVVKLPHTGTPGLPRNEGIKAARGKYIAFLDSDDLFTKTALEELSTLAEQFQADVVSINGSYRLYKGIRRSIDDSSMTDMNELTNPKNFTTVRFFRDKSLKEPTLKPENFAERLELFTKSPNHNYGVFSSFCRRDFLIGNQISFKDIPAGEDQVFNFTCLCLAKKFLRVPGIYYIVRPRDDSIMREATSSPMKFFLKRVRAFKCAFVEVERVMNQIPFFNEHPDYKYSVYEKFAFFRLAGTTNFYADKTASELNELIKQEFSPDTADYITYLFNTVNVQRLRIKELEAANSSTAGKIPLVSVVIPMFNSAKFIPQTLESLLYQTMTDFEVVVIDDGSTDNSVEVVESFSARFAQRVGGGLYVVKLPHTGMPGNPRNVGIQFARGKYIAFLDSDDLFTKTALEEFSTLAEKYQADVVRFDGYFKLWDGKARSIDAPEMTDFNELTNPKNQSLKLMRKEPLDKPTLESPDVGERVQNWLRPSVFGFWSTWLFFYRRDFLIANQIKFAAMPVFSDAPFAFEALCLAKNYLNANGTVCIIRPRKGSIMRDGGIITLEQQIHKRGGLIKTAFNEFERIMSRVPYFAEHPDVRYAVLEWVGARRFPIIKKQYAKGHPVHQLNEYIKKEFHPDDAPLAAYMFNSLCQKLLRIDELEAKLAAPK